MVLHKNLDFNCFFLEKLKIFANSEDGMVLTWPPHSGGE